MVTTTLTQGVRASVATKYLDHYLGWRRLLDKDKFITPNQLFAIIGRQLEAFQPLMHT